MSRLDMVFAEQTGRALEGVDLTLRGVSDAYLHGNGESPAAFDALLRRRIAGVRQAMAIAIVAAGGAVSFVSDPGLGGLTFPASVRALIDDTILHPGPSPRISDPFKLTDGKWTALMARSVPDPGGARHAAVAFLNLNYFEDFYKAVELTEDAAITLHRRDGTVLARYPHNDGAIGQSYADLPPFKDVLSKGVAGTLLMDSPLDGSRRVLAIRALKAFPVAVNVSVGVPAVLATWRREALVFGLASAAVAALIGGLLIMLIRRSRDVEQLVRDLEAANVAAEAANRRMAAEMEERERVEYALRQAQRSEAIGQLTGGVAHDFNNLLAVVMGNIDLVELTAGQDAKMLGRLATMRAAVERGATLTSQLLAFSRRQPLVPRPTDLNALVTGLRALVQSALGSRIKLHLALLAELEPVLIDKAQIELVVLNLAINARDAMPNGGTLTIETGLAELEASARAEDPPPGRYVVLRVRDTGCGMTREVMAKAFEPFFTTKEVGRGSGLGLSQVYGTARQLGGGARIESAIGQGTTVHVYLQPAPSGARSPSGPAGGRPSRAASRARVLLVDDDHPVRATTGAVLNQLGYAVQEAGSGGEALETMERARPDLLLTDVVMPGMTGPELARRARARFPHLPVVFISGYTDPNALAGEGGLVHLIRKPFRPEELVEKIEAALAAAVAVG